LTDPTFFRDSGEAPFLDHSNEHLHGIEFVQISLPIPQWNGFYARSSDSFVSLSDVKNTDKK